MSFTQIFCIIRIAAFNPGSNPCHSRALNSVYSSNSYTHHVAFPNHGLTLP